MVMLHVTRAVTVQADLFDALGRKVMQLLDAPLSSGSHRLSLDPHELASGVYYCRIRAGTAVRTLAISVAR